MKKLVMIALGTMIMISCNNPARDGDPNTDAQNLPRDTNRGKTTTDHTNRADGPVPLDSSQRDSSRQ